MTALAVATLDTDLDTALALGGRALGWVEARGEPLLCSVRCATASALVLGALQREDTLRGRSPARFTSVTQRRRTTGTEAQLQGEVLYHALALPRVDSLYADAKARTLLNRNLRLLMRGYGAAGIPLRYFGTEVLALLGHPVALVGYDQTASGAVLIEVLVGLESPCVVRSALRRAPAAALLDLLTRDAADGLIERVTSGVTSQLGGNWRDVAAEVATHPSTPSTAAPPEGPHRCASVSIPLGVVEVALEPRVRFSGDLLVSAAALGRVEQFAQEALDQRAPLTPDLLAPLQGAPLDGARATDLLAALEAARAAAP